MTEEVTQQNDLQNQTDPAQTAQTESADLNVADLNGMKTIIDLASSRGAFKPNEMMAVGQIYMKLSNFLAESARSLVFRERIADKLSKVVALLRPSE